MKTTYQSKSNGSRSEIDSQYQEQASNSALVDTYLDLKKTSDKVNSKAMHDVSVGADESLEQSYTQALKKEKEVKKKKGSKIPIVLCAILFIAVVGIIGFLYIEDKNEKELLSQYNAWVNSVNDIYLTLEDEDVVTQPYRELSAVYEAEGIDTSDVIVELNTIDAYMVDRAKIKALQSADVNLVSAEYQAVLDEVESNVDSNYSVADLRVSIKDMIKEAENKVVEYNKLNDAMYNDVEFSREKYQSQIDAIVQDIQRSELLGIAKLKEADIALVEANNHYTEVDVEVENEGVKDWKLTKAQRTARDEAIVARDQAVANALVAIDEAELALHEAKCELYSVQDTIYGTRTLDEYVVKWEEENGDQNAEAEESTESDK